MILLTRITVSHIQKCELDLFQPKIEEVRLSPTRPVCNSIHKTLNRDKRTQNIDGMDFPTSCPVGFSLRVCVCRFVTLFEISEHIIIEIYKRFSEPNTLCAC